MVVWSSLRHQQPGIDSFLRLRLSQIKARLAAAQPPKVVGSGVESKVMPMMSIALVIRPHGHALDATGRKSARP
jgi:hypothetical protein